MKIEEAIKIEDNKNIYLHNEGLFWRAYEYSACSFVKNILQYNIQYKYFKGIKQDVVFLGFPQNALQKILDIANNKKYVVEKPDQNRIIITAVPKLSDYFKCKNEIISKVKKESEIPDTDVLKKIADFPLAMKTPIEAQQFLYIIQKQINGNL